MGLAQIYERVLVFWFRNVPLPDGLSDLKDSYARAVFVTQSDSAVVTALLTSLCTRAGLPAPTKATVNGSGLVWLSVHDSVLLEALMQQQPQRRFITLNSFHLRGPIRSNPGNRMSSARLFSLVIGRRLLFTVLGQPISLEGAPSPVSLRQATRRLRVDFYRNLKVIRGTPIQSLDSQARHVLAGTEFERELRIVAQRQNIPAATMRAHARREFFQIAANPRRMLYGIAAPIANLLLRRLFSEVVTRGLDRVIPAVRDHTVVVVPMHRSHLDYILLGAKFYESNLNPPVVAAGINLGFWPVGPLIRNLGAYFVRRDAKHDRVHALVLRRYVTYLIKRGHLQEFFIEGGRSRNGKMRAPKVGLLGIIIDAYQKQPRRDIHFVPTSITYENVIEDKTFGDENTGESKIKENLFSLLNARKIFRNKYGEVIITFGQPICLSDYLRERLANGETRAVALDLGLLITREIRDNIALSLTSLAYSALLMAPRYGLTRTTLVQTIHNLSALAGNMRRVKPALAQTTPSLARFLSGRESILDDILRGGIAMTGRYLDEPIFYIPGQRRFTADFYKNSSVHVFLIPAVLAIAELIDGKISPERVMSFHAPFASDFLLPNAEIFRSEVTRTIAAMLETGVLTKNAKGDSSMGSDNETCAHFTRRDVGLFVPGMLLGSLQSYLWVCKNLQDIVDSETRAAPEQGVHLISYPEFLDRLLSTFRSAAYLGVLTRTEAASMTSLTTVLESLHTRKVINLQESGGKRDKIAITGDVQLECQFFALAEQKVSGWLNSAAPTLIGSCTAAKALRLPTGS